MKKHDKQLEKSQKSELNDAKKIGSGEKGKKKTVWGESARFKDLESDDRTLLYPKYDLSRPNLHGNKAVMKKPNKEFVTEK